MKCDKYHTASFRPTRPCKLLLTVASYSKFLQLLWGQLKPQEVRQGRPKDRPPGFPLRMDTRASKKRKPTSMLLARRLASVSKFGRGGQP